ncbi:hypothetical protein [Spirosoma gilvum]
MFRKAIATPGYLLTYSLSVLLAICLLLTLLVRYRLIFLASSDIGGIESNVIYSIQRFLAGYSLYGDPEVAPYSITQYSPLYYRLVAAIGRLIHINPDDPLQVYRLSRTISLCANILYSLLLIGLSLCFQLKLRIAVSVAVIAFVLLPPQTYSRPDSLYSVFVLATLYAGIRSIQTDLTRAKFIWLAGAVMASAFAISTKQSGIILPIILTTYYAFWRRQWLTTLLIGVGIGLSSLVLLLVLMPEHNPYLLYVNLVKGVSQGLDWTSFKINIYDHYLRPYCLHNAFGIALCFWLLQQTRADYRWLGWFTLLVVGFAFITSLKQGSALNYFTDFISLTGLIVALWLNSTYQSSSPWLSHWSVLIVSVVFWSVVPNLSNFDWPLALKKDALSAAPYYEQKKVASYLTDSLRLQPTDAVYITNYNYCYLNGLLFRNCILPQQEIVLVMYPRQELSYAAFNSQIQQGKIRFLITRPNETQIPFPGLRTDQYILRRKFPDFDVYERLPIPSLQPKPSKSTNLITLADPLN